MITCLLLSILYNQKVQFPLSRVSTELQPFMQHFGFAKRATICYVAGFNFNLLYTIGGSDCETLQGRLPGFVGILLLIL